MMKNLQAGRWQLLYVAAIQAPPPWGMMMEFLGLGFLGLPQNTRNRIVPNTA
jgi:hypothetical protein